MINLKRTDATNKIAAVLFLLDRKFLLELPIKQKAFH